MAHVRKNCKNLSTTISFEPEVLKALDDYRFNKRKENRSQALADLIKKGLKYERLVEKKKARMLG